MFLKLYPSVQIILALLILILFYGCAKPNIPNKEITNGVWAWNRLDNLSKTSQYSISTVYLQRHNTEIDEPFRQDAKQLKNGYIFWLLDGNTASIDDPSFIQYDISILDQALKEHIEIQGLHLDIELYTRADYTPETMENLWRRYLITLKNVADELHKRGLKLSISIPFWLDTITLNNRPLCDQVMDIADETVIMSYRTDSNDLLATVEHELNYAQTHGKSIFLAVDLSPSNEANGEKLSFFNHKNKLKDVITIKINNISFKGWVFHSLDDI
ncbi:MAG: hypothetical protein PHO27_08755 [Sulfuricurvum sp.]|nr:hypothetical protein [Sulfuricurvum sp.]